MADNEHITSGSGSGDGLPKLTDVTQSIPPADLPTKPYKKLVIVGILAALFTIAVLAKDSVLLAFRPDLYLFNAVSATVMKVKSEKKTAAKAIFDMSNFYGSTFTADFNLKLSGVFGSSSFANSIKNYEGFGISGDIKCDSASKQLAINTGLFYSDNRLLSSKLFWTDDEIGFNIPELFGEWLTAPTKDAGKKWSNSTVGKLSNVKFDENMDISFGKIIDLFKSNASDKETKAKYNNAAALMLKDMKISNAGRCGVDVGGSRIICRKIEVILDSGSIKDGIVEYLNAMQGDRRMAEYSRSIPNNTVNLPEYIAIVKDFVKNYFSLDDGCKIDFYVYKNYIVRLEANLSPRLMDEKCPVTVNGSLAGGRNLTDKINLAAQLGLPGEKLTIVFDSSGGNANSSGIYNDNTTLTINMQNFGNVIYEYKWMLDTAKKSGNLKSSLHLSAGGTTLGIDAEGSYISSNQGFNLDIDTLTLDMPGDGGSNTKLKLEGSLNCKKGAGTIVETDGVKKIKLLDMSQSELTSFGIKVQSRLNDVLKNIQHIQQ